MSVSPLAMTVACAALAVACAPARSAKVVSPESPPVPISAVTDQQDEWLHDYCTPKKLVSAISIADADRQIRASEGNFGEVVYETSSMQIVAFACPGKPTWTVDSRVGSAP